MIQYVLIRTYSAGVHFGMLSFKNGKEVHLENARRIWRWKGANTINELSQNGADFEWTRISEAVPRIELTEAIEIIPCSEIAIENLKQSRWPS
jgi:hypothetical protein